MATRRTLIDRCKTTLASQKTRAKKYGAFVAYTADDLAALVSDCRYCRKKLTPAIVNFDHRIPVSRGGAWTLDNLDAICASDNRRKGELTDAEYETLLRALDTLPEFAAKNILKRLAAGAAFIHG